MSVLTSEMPFGGRGLDPRSVAGLYGENTHTIKGSLVIFLAEYSLNIRVWRRVDYEMPDV